MTHATRGHRCGFCDRISFGNGGQVSHGRAHVRRGEAVELVKHHDSHPPMTSRLFLAPDDPRISEFAGRGFAAVGDN